jgi:hypothetical protein
MTTLNLPNEIINKIFSYIEGKHNQIIKNGLTTTFWTNREVSTFDIKFAFDLIKCNLLRDKQLSNHTDIEYHKYFKYTVLHRQREILFDYIKNDLRELIDEYDYYYRITYHVLQNLRETYIHNYNYENIIKKNYDTYFKYTILHENLKNVFNDIKRYNTKKDDICNKKLSTNILLKRGILTNYIKQHNNKIQKKWN